MEEVEGKREGEEARIHSTWSVERGGRMQEREKIREGREEREREGKRRQGEGREKNEGKEKKRWEKVEVREREKELKKEGCSLMID